MLVRREYVFPHGWLFFFEGQGGWASGGNVQLQHVAMVSYFFLRLEMEVWKELMGFSSENLD